MKKDFYFNEFSESLKTDVVVIGAGAAGIRAAIEASDNAVNVIILSKGRLINSGSTFYKLCQGWGIQLISKEEGRNTYDNFFKEILEVGEGMVLPELAEILITEVPRRVHELEKWGINFHKTNGHFLKFLCCFADIEREVAGALDMENIQNCFRNEVAKRNIKVIDNFKVVKIITGRSLEGKRVRGIAGIDKDGNLMIVESKAVILATGGGSIIFNHNMNSPELTGDGYTLALDAGACLINMEYIQFIYGIIAPKKIHLNDKVIESYSSILNARKERFIEKYIPKDFSINEIIKERVRHGPFTSRLISKYFDFAIYSEIMKGNGTDSDSVYLDLRNLKNEIKKIKKKYPTFGDWFSWLQKRLTFSEEDLIEISLCAHANNGGILVNGKTMTEIIGLFACGEVMAGPHGADREGGNMMASTLVFGKIAGENAANLSKTSSHIKVNKDIVLKEVNSLLVTEKEAIYCGC